LSAFSCLTLYFPVQYKYHATLCILCYALRAMRYAKIMSQIIDGRALADKIKDKIVQEVIKIIALPTREAGELNRRPNLAIILVGERPDSALYVARKQTEAKKCGIDTHLYKFAENASEQELLDCVGYLNRDDLIDGILLQMPLPPQFNADKIVAAISPNKEVDGFHPDNLAKIHACLPLLNKKSLPRVHHWGAGVRSYQMPVLAAVILEILTEIKCDLRGKTVALLAHSDIFMSGVGEILKQCGAKILPCCYDKNNTNQLQNCGRQADIVITAVGKKHYLTADYLKPDTIVIDIGIIREGDETFGDVDFASASKVASFITPVPGGVGPMTIACALRNVVELYKKYNTNISN